MVFRKKNIIVIILIISFLGGPLVYKANATDWFAAMKFGLDVAAKAAAQTVFKILSNKIIQKVQTGGIAGGPAFVQNWRNFQLESQYRGEDIWRGLLYVAANGEGVIPPLLCDHIRNSGTFRSLLPREIPGLTQSTLALKRRINNLQDPLVSLQCDPIVNDNFDVFMNDFLAGGGWDTFERLLQPQNNIYGAIGLAMEELPKQRSIEQSSAINESGGGGKGFTSLRKACKKTGLSGDCIIPGDINTPASLLDTAVSNVIDGNIKFFTTADAASMVISTLVSFATEKLFDLANANINPSTEIGELRTAESYKNEFCTAKDDMSGQAIDYIRITYPVAFANFPVSRGKSYCERFRKDNNPFPFERCINACYKAVGLLPNEVLVPTFSETPPPQPQPGGGLCSDQGGTPNYAGDLQSAINAVIASNPDGIADAFNTRTNSFLFLGYVVQELQSAGFNATTSVLNGNGNPNNGDLIAVWQNGDSTVERYDAVIAAGDADRTIRAAAQAGYTGDIPFACVI